jgi:hypothetical protein
MIIEFTEDDLRGHDRAAIQERIDDVRHADGLRRRDREFLDSIQQHLDERGWLTPKQLVWLDSLYEKYVGS